MNDDDEILQKVWELSNKTAERLAKLHKSGKTVTVKIKTFKFETLSKQRSLHGMKPISIMLHIVYIPN